MAIEYLTRSDRTDLRIEDDGKYYSLGQTIQIGLTKQVHQRTTRKPWSRCIEDYPAELTQRNSSGILEKRFYSKHNCMYTCLMTASLENGGCLPHTGEEWISLGTKFPHLAPCNATEMMDG